MSRSLAEELLQKISAHIAERLGLDFPESKWKEMEQAFSRAAKDYGFQGAVECANWFLTAPQTRSTTESVAGYLTIGETYFLREPQCFKVFEQEIIPEIVRLRQGCEQRIRIWSAACSTGEEPYTIAILLHQMRHLLHGWEISILASDVNTNSLHKAREGEYGTWSFRDNTPPWFRDNYFTKTAKGRYKIIDSIREMVNFAAINLAEDPYPSLLNDTNAIDVIFCRNLLMYFTPDRAKLAIEHFHRCLVAGGWFIVSPCEVFDPSSLGFTVISYPGAIVFSKSDPAVVKTAARKWSIPMAVPPNVEPQLVYPQNNTIEPSMDAAPPHAHSLPAIGDEPSLYERAQALYNQGLYAEAGDLLTNLISQHSGDPQAYVLMCRTYANEGKLAEALRLSEQALATNKLDMELRYLHAIILQELGMVNEAIEALKRVLYLDPDMVLAHFTLGNLSLKQRKNKDSRKYFNNALELLSRYHPDAIVPEADGLLAGRLIEIIRSAEVMA
jgi:chemotaxis protein methyltransferase CheR